MGQRSNFRHHHAENPDRFEDLDLTPMEESLHHPPRESIRDLVSQYVRSMQPERPLSEIDTEDFTDEDPDEMVLTDHQLLAMAYEHVAEEQGYDLTIPDGEEDGPPEGFTEEVADAVDKPAEPAPPPMAT